MREPACAIPSLANAQPEAAPTQIGTHNIEAKEGREIVRRSLRQRVRLAFFPHIRQLKNSMEIGGGEAGYVRETGVPAFFRGPIDCEGGNEPAVCFLRIRKSSLLMAPYPGCSIRFARICYGWSFLHRR